jgi:hypothetical protein
MPIPLRSQRFCGENMPSQTIFRWKKSTQLNRFLEWSSPWQKFCNTFWHFMTYVLTSYLTLYGIRSGILTDILTFYVAFYLTISVAVWHEFWHSMSHILSGIGFGFGPGGLHAEREIQLGIEVVARRSMVRVSGGSCGPWTGEVSDWMWVWIDTY